LLCIDKAWVDKELMRLLHYVKGCRLKANREWAEGTLERFYELEALIAEVRAERKAKELQ